MERHQEAVAGRGAVAERHQEAAAGRGTVAAELLLAKKTQGCIGKLLLEGVPEWAITSLAHHA